MANMGENFFVVKDTKERVFGGYTDKAFDGFEGWKTGNKKSFLYSFKDEDTIIKCECLKQENEIYGGTDSEPIVMGYNGGIDFYIKDRCESGDINYSVLGNGFQKNDLPNDSLAGEKYFTVKELEIFRVKNQD